MTKTRKPTEWREQPYRECSRCGTQLPTLRDPKQKYCGRVCQCAANHDAVRVQRFCPCGEPIPLGSKKRFCPPCADESTLNKRKTRNLALRGFTPEIYESMLAKQNGVCAACGEFRLRKGTERMPAHHNHVTGEPVAVLCTQCNVAMGMMEDSIERVRMLLAFAERYHLND